MIQTTIQAAQTNLPQLLEKMLDGEEIIIEQDGKALARIVPMEKNEKAQYNSNWFGMDEGKIWMAPDFNETPQEVIDAFYGEDE